MKKQYSSQLPLLKELFSDWTEVDLLFALQETDGDLESTIERISEGARNSQLHDSNNHSSFSKLIINCRPCIQVLRRQERKGKVEAKAQRSCV
jgi:hypothetical protein